MAIAKVFNSDGGTASKTQERVYGENLSSQLNGSNLVLTLSQSYQAGSIALFYNGLRQSSNEFQETSSTTITLTISAPANGESVIIDFNPK